MKTHYYVSEEGGIVDADGVLYDADSLAELSPAARQRLAELHNATPGLQWEGSRAEGRLGAWDILVVELRQSHGE